MKSLKDRIRSRYNCSVAEVDFQDQWQRARLAVCVVSDDGGHVTAQLNEIARFASGHHLAEVLDYSIEMR